MKTPVILELSDKGTFYLWVGHECIREWKGRNTSLLGKPLEIAEVVCQALTAAEIQVHFEVANHITGDEWDGHPFTGLWASDR